MSAFETLAEDNAILCDPCENEGRYTQAEGYCTDCNDNLCSECLKVHRRPVLWRFHQILHRDEIPKVKTLGRIQESCVEPCPKHRSKILEYFCQTHDELACSLCMFRSHRFCEVVSYIPDIAKSVVKSKETEDLKDNCSGLLNDIAAYKKLTEKGIKEVNEIKKNAVEKVTDLRHEICNFLDKLLEDISFINHSDISNIKASNRCFKKVEKQLKTSLTVLEKKEKESKMSQLFVATKLFKTNLKEMQAEVDKSKNHCTIQHYEVAVTGFNVLEMRRCLEKIWKLDVQKSFPLNEKGNQFSSKEAIKSLKTDSKKWPSFENLLKHADGTALNQNRGVCCDQTKLMKEERAADLNTAGKDGEKATGNKGVWSPSNPNGIRQYGRKFLMQLRTSFHSLQKPFGILDIPGIVFDQTDVLSTDQSLVNDIKKSSDECVRKENGIGETAISLRSADITVKSDRVFTEQDNNSVTKLEGFVEVKQSREGVPMKTIKHQLYEYIVKGTADNLGVIAWINCHVDESVTTGNSFIRTLMTDICKHSLEKDDEDECVFDVEKIRDRGDLLVKYLKHNPDTELQALYALQLYIGKRKHPPGNIREILDVLYDDSIISEDGFFKWETSKEMEECGEMFLKQTVPFFTWLLTKDRRKR